MELGSENMGVYCHWLILFIIIFYFLFFYFLFFIIYLLSWTCKSSKQFKNSLPFFFLYYLFSFFNIYLFLFCFYYL